MLATLAATLATTLAVASPTQAPTNLSVMTYNIWVGGTRHQPLSQTVAAIKAAQADIVGVQEPGPNLQALADALGYHASPEAAILSRFPIAESFDVPDVNWGGVKIVLPSGQTIFVYNCHLTAYPYGPYELRDKRATTPEALAEVERASGRLPQVQRMLADIATRVPDQATVFFTGDFNAPSHLDWVESTKSRTFGLAMPWPVSKAVHAAGFRDSFREIHPDPAKTPGFTWSPGYPVPNIAEDDVMDRIDFVYFRGPNVQLKSTHVVAEKGPHTDIPLDPWPSDHRALVSRFQINR